MDNIVTKEQAARLYQLSDDEILLMEFNTTRINNVPDFARTILERLIESASLSDNIKLIKAKDVQTGQDIPNRLVVIAKNYKQNESPRKSLADTLKLRELVCNKCGKQVGTVSITMPDNKHFTFCRHCKTKYMYNEEKHDWVMQ